MFGLGLLMTHRVTVLEAQQRVSAAGSTTPDWSQPPIELGTFRAAVQGRSGVRETDGQRQGAVSQWRVYLDPDVPVDHTNRLRWGSRVLEVDSTPRVVTDHLRGVAHHLEVDAREALG